MEKGYFEVNELGNLWQMPVMAFAGNVIYNGRHWHEHIEIILCVLGESFVTIEEKEYLLSKGDFVVINSGQSHITRAKEEGCLQVICSIKKDALQGMDDHWIFCNSTADGRVSKTDREEIVRLLCDMAKLLADGSLIFEEEARLKNLSYQYKLLSILSRYKVKIDSEKTKYETLISQVVRYIHEHMTQALNAELLSREFHVSQSTIYRIFYKEMGVHLNEYITNLRISAACRMLQNQKDTVTEIAYACGFSSLSNFYRAFKEKIGQSPKEYQKENPMISTPYLIHQPDIMKLNQFQHFWETGFDVNVLEEVQSS